MIGAHYTSTEDILLLIEPVIMTPLRRRWATVQDSVLDALRKEEAAAVTSTQKSRPLKLNRPALTLLQDWAAELSACSILDPACGSGNFLYVALKRLLDLWHEARVFGIAHGLTLALDPIPHPGQLFGIEIDFYAHEIASIVVWIGFLQWKHDHGIKDQKEPLLQKLTNLERGDAVLCYDESQKSEEHPNGKPYEPIWPPADYIVGNPPFLGDKRMRAELGDTYVQDLRSLYSGRVSGGADLVTYWFEHAREAIFQKRSRRAGLLATNSISMVGNRSILKRIKETGDIFMAWSDRAWTLNGAAVRVAMVGFDGGADQEHVLDGHPVSIIHADLSAEAAVISAKQLAENENIAFLGMMKGGPFEIDEATAKFMADAPLNPNGSSNREVIRPRLGGQDITGRNRDGWIIDFNNLTEAQAAFYELPFGYLKHHVKPLRMLARDKSMRRDWWLHGRRRPAFRSAIKSLTRFLATPEASKHRLFVWVPSEVLPDHKLHVFARGDDYFFGVLHSCPHETWTLATCSWIGQGNDPSYNSESTFNTFPLPWPPGTEPSEADSSIVYAIADAARQLVHLRDNWLNPQGPTGQPLPESELRGRTLTKLYNARPQWLTNAHTTLDRAVFAAYGWPEDPATLPKQDILARLLALNHERAAAQTKQAVSTP